MSFSIAASRGTACRSRTGCGPTCEGFYGETVHESAIVGDLFDRRYIAQLMEEHQTYRANHNHVLWALINLAVWHRLFVESSPPRRATAQRPRIEATR